MDNHQKTIVDHCGPSMTIFRTIDGLLSHALFVFSMFGLLSVKLICALNGFLVLEFAGRARRLPAKNLEPQCPQMIL